MLQNFRSPLCRLVLVAQVAGVGRLVAFRHRRSNESERVAAHEIVGKRLLDLRHVAVYALAARGSGQLMRMAGDGRGVRSVRRIRPWHSRHNSFAGRIRSASFPVPCTSWQVKHFTPCLYVTLCTQSFPCMRFLCAVPSENCVSSFSRDAAAPSARNRAAATGRQNRRPNRSFSHRGDSRADVLANGTECTPGWGARIRAELGLRCLRVMHWTPVRCLGHGSARRPRSTRLLFLSGCCRSRVAAVAKRARGALPVVGGIERGLPVGTAFDELRQPFLMRDVPLRGKWEIIVPDSGEVSLLPPIAVDERDILSLAGDQRIGFGKIRQNGVREFARIANHVGHRRLSPALLNRRMAGFAHHRSRVAGERLCLQHKRTAAQRQDMNCRVTLATRAALDPDRL
jgi:hypothetical protein